MKRYRKLPVVIEAEQFTGDETQAKRLGIINNAKYGPPIWVIGVLQIRPGDWLIKGVKDELYPCPDDVFKLTYEPA
jgi:hypothetical protein